MIRGVRTQNIFTDKMQIYFPVHTEIIMNLAFGGILRSFPRLELFSTPTPIQRLERTEQALGPQAGGVRIFVKRDDHMELGGGGNKLRKLEYHLGEAITRGCDTIITMGGLQSNHARLTAAAAARVGLACELVLANVVARTGDDYEHNGNVLLDQVFGARLHTLPANADVAATVNAITIELSKSGRNVFVIPTGGSTPLGALGYVRCAQEIVKQESLLGVRFAQVIVPNGSSGTHAGLAAGFALLDRGVGFVRSFAVLADYAATMKKTRELTHGTLRLFGEEARFSADSINIDDTHRGTGYGIPTDEMIHAVQLLARNEGLLLDPVYSGKAFAGLLADIRSRRYPAGTNVLFVMTGGTPGLYAYRTAFETAFSADL